MAPRGSDNDVRRDEDIGRAAVRQALGAVAGLLRVGIVAVDTEGRAWFRSQRWEDRTGTGGGAPAERHWYEGVHPDDQDEVVTRWRSLVGRRGRLGTFRTVGIDGVVRRCRAESVPMIAPDGRSVGHLLLVADVADEDGSGGWEAGSENGTSGERGAARPVLSTPQVLEKVLEGAPDIITILNPDGSWRWSSGAALRLLGHQAEFDPQTGLFGLLHPDDAPLAARGLERALGREDGPPEPVIVRIRVADGSWRVMECSVDVLLEEPSVGGIVVHARDVTVRQQVLADLEATNRRLDDVISSMRAAVLAEDEHGDVVMVNDAFLKLFRLRFTADDLIGRKLREVTGVSLDQVVVDPPGAADLARTLREEGKAQSDRAVMYDGRTIEYDFLPTRTETGDWGSLWTIRDVTRQARAETERERLLASEREENRRLAETDAFRSESIAAVSHELRTPLTSIVGYTQLLRNMIDRAERPEEAECLDAISRNVDRLLRLAGDVVALDSLESRTLPLRLGPVDIAGTLRQAATTVAPQVVEKDIELVVDISSGHPLHGDADRLVQLFDNLLSNAVKFTPSGGRVTLAARPVGGQPAAGGRGGGRVGGRGDGGPPAGGGGEGWAVEVTDTGIGIPDDELEHLFGRFFRASNARTRGIPGSGLGLSVARAIAERHGGTVEVRSVVGAGTTVTVTLRDASEEEGEGIEIGRDGPAQGDGRRRVPDLG